MKTMVANKKEATVYPCGYCGKEYKRESTLINHKCEQKKRALMRDTKEAKLALDIWLRFRTLARMPPKKSMQPYEAFSESREFKAFVEFASHVLELRIIEADKFIDYVLRLSIPIRDWTSHKTCNGWVQHTLKNEPIDHAISRSMESIVKWSEDTGHDWTDFFKLVSPQRAVLLIETGRISPWFIYASSTRGEMLDRFADEEFVHIYDYINPHIWNTKKLKHKEHFSHVEETFLKYGL